MQEHIMKNQNRQHELDVDRGEQASKSQETSPNW
jgi:hypothetical protein